MHMAQLMPLPLNISCSSKIQIGFTFLVPADPGSPRKRAVKSVCVCVCSVQSTLQLIVISSRSDSVITGNCTGKAVAASLLVIIAWLIICRPAAQLSYFNFGLWCQT